MNGRRGGALGCAPMRRLALLAQPPTIGQAKPRLSPALPPGAAAALAGALLEDAVDAMRAAAAPDERFLSWVGADGTLLGREVPGGEDPGARLAAAFQSLVQIEGDRGVLFGADCPSLTAATIDLAFEKLEGADVVLAPTRAGGVGLIGLSRSAEALFRDGAWSTGRVLAQLAERAESLGMSLVRLDPVEDVDTAEDLCRLLAAAVTPGATIGPSTRLALGKLGMLPAALASPSAAVG